MIEQVPEIYNNLMARGKGRMLCCCCGCCNFCCCDCSSVIVVVSITVLFYDDKGPFITTTLPMTFLHSYIPGKWKQIATTQMEKHLVTTVEDMRQQAKRWMDTYNFDVIENLVAPPKCVVCGEQAAKRCSKCRQEWYAITLPSSGVVQCASFTVLYSCTVLTVSAMKI